MNIRQILLAGTAAMVLTTSPVWAGEGKTNHDKGNSGSEPSTKTPETNAKPGTQAIALIAAASHDSPNTNHDKGNSGSEPSKAPETNVKPGKNPIALIKGVFHESANSNHDKPNSHHVIGNGGGEHFKAPEIDAKSGTSALALLTGVLLLVSERSRSRRSKDQEGKNS